MVVEIPLRNSPLKVLVDDEDAELVGCYEWGLFRGYAYNRQAGYMHQFIVMNMPDECFSDKMVENVDPDLLVVMHLTDDKLDNRRKNLRLVPRACSSRHAKKPSHHAGKPTSSQYKGVCWLPKRRRWQATIRDGDRSRWIGNYKTEEEAARAYDKRALELFGPCARLNFPEGSCTNK